MNGLSIHKIFCYICCENLFLMSTFNKKLISTAVLLVGIAYASFADKGVSKRNKAKTVLNISTSATLKNSIFFNLKTGLTYKGSLLVPSNKVLPGTVGLNTTLITYQKGNTTYIIPYKQKLVMPDMRQGYSGVKIVIRHK
jgi:hypothetical protein